MRYTHVAGMEAMISEYEILVGKPEGKGLLNRPRRTWKDNIKVDINEVGYKNIG
jgi:hypothetical protein